MDAEEDRMTSIAFAVPACAGVGVRRRAIAMALGCALLAGPGPAAGQAAPGEDRGAGAWRTWVLTSGDQFRLPQPPDAIITRGELAMLRDQAPFRDAAMRARIAWWDAAAPSYRWNQIAVEAAIAAGLNANMASRHLAVLHTALADAMVAAWDSKYAYNRPRPATVDPTVETLVATPVTPSYPDEHAVAGAVAATLLAQMFPARADHFARLGEEAGLSRLVAGVSFPSDVASGMILGHRIAAAALERAARDRSDLPWTGRVPTTPGLWNGTNPIMPQAATWVPWLLASPDEFRPAPPPAHDSPERAAEMAVVRNVQRTPWTNSQALFWDIAVGGLRNYEYWNIEAGRLLMEHGEARNAPRAARALALLNVAFYDVGVACWDAKYTFWTIRPFQLDPSFRTVFPTANHPAYPAAHSCFSMTSALVLSHLYPREEERLRGLGRISGDSRVWAGIHYPSDVTVGQEMAARVAGRVIERAVADGSAPAVR
jgi:membrane-associated phospholipid phosphatase